MQAEESETLDFSFESQDNSFEPSSKKQKNEAVDKWEE